MHARPIKCCADTGRGHGTHTAGIVGAVGDNGVGLSGGSWNVALWICRAESPTIGIPLSSALACYTHCGNQVRFCSCACSQSKAALETT